MWIFHANHRIDAPEYLTAILGAIKQAVAFRRLFQVPSGHPAWDVDIRTLDAGGPWPDCISASFVDERGRRFRLEVETYHGGGGAWTIIDGGAGV